MKTKKLTIAAVMLAIGFVLHLVVPAILFGMKPDFLLLMMVLAIAITKDLTSAITITLASGLITAATTTFPGGQVANIIDKIITGIFVYLLNSKIVNYNSFKMAILTFFATMISGMSFLAIGLTITGAFNTIGNLILVVVLPTAFMNCAMSFLLYKPILRFKQRALLF